MSTYFAQQDSQRFRPFPEYWTPNIYISPHSLGVHQQWRPPDAILILLLGNNPLVLTQDSWGAGFPVVELNRQSSNITFVDSQSGGRRNGHSGVEVDFPGLPLIPGIPSDLITPIIPFSPLIPDGPIPYFPLRPDSPIIPSEPFLPLLSGGPGSPCGQKLRVPFFWQIFLKLRRWQRLPKLHSNWLNYYSFNCW